MRPVLLALFLAACTSVESDLSRTAFKESWKDLLAGGDRRYPGYRAVIEEATVNATPRYRYAAPAHVSQYRIHRAVRGLGKTELRHSRDMAGVVDQLLYVLARDPTSSVRSSACHALGRIVVRLPTAALPEATPDANSKIHEVATDLFAIQAQLEEGGRVKIQVVIERLETLAAQRPGGFRSAREAVRVLAAPPVATATSPAVREAHARVTPDVVRGAVLTALAEVACGSPGPPATDPDPDAVVRVYALDVLVRSRSPVAVDAAAARLWDPVDPAEREASVRRALVRYLGAAGGPLAFEACRRRLDDTDSSVRYHAHQSLVRMTGASPTATADAWSSWRARHPKWTLVDPPADG